MIPGSRPGAKGLSHPMSPGWPKSDPFSDVRDVWRGVVGVLLGSAVPWPIVYESTRVECARRTSCPHSVNLKGMTA